VTTPDTKDLILDAAERLFAEHGFAATSMRTITSEAGVNLAAVHYHFGSKDALILAVLERRLSGVNHERIELLDAYEAERTESGAGPDLEALIRLFVGPAIQLSSSPERGGAALMRLLGQAYTEPGGHLFKLFHERFGEFIRRFVAAFCAALPGLPLEEVAWHFHFMVGTMAHTMAAAQKLHELWQEMGDITDTDAVIERLVAHNAAGMRAAHARWQAGCVSETET
jgi:AcrR family transcriptional regulator